MMFGLAFCILLIILFSIDANKKYHEMKAFDFILDVVILQGLIYTTLNTIKSVF